jgi:hypothetical protein
MSTSSADYNAQIIDEFRANQQWTRWRDVGGNAGSSR